MPVLDRITIYPVKSLDGVEVATALVLPCGALENDRRWRLVDMERRVVNAKRMPLVQAVRATFLWSQEGNRPGPTVRLSCASSGDGGRRFNLLFIF